MGRKEADEEAVKGIIGIVATKGANKHGFDVEGEERNEVNEQELDGS